MLEFIITKSPLAFVVFGVLELICFKNYVAIYRQNNIVNVYDFGAIKDTILLNFGTVVALNILWWSYMLSPEFLKIKLLVLLFNTIIGCLCIHKIRLTYATRYVVSVLLAINVIRGFSILGVLEKLYILG